MSCVPCCRPNGILGAPGLCPGWSPRPTVRSSPEEECVTYLSVQPRPPGGQHVLAEPRRAPAAPLPGGSIQNLYVRVAHDPVHTEVGRLSRPACLGAAHACWGRWRNQRQHSAGLPRARPAAGGVCARAGWHSRMPPFSPLTLGRVITSLQLEP